MYSGITQSKMAEELFMSESKYSRKENGRAKFTKNEALKIAKILQLNERMVLKYWMSDKLFELMCQDKDLVYEALQIVEMNYENYDTCIDVPHKHYSFSSFEERKRHSKKKI